MLNLNQYFRSGIVHQYHKVVMAAVLGLLVGAGLTFLFLPAPVLLEAPSVTEVQNSSEELTLEPAKPRQLRIPKVGIDTVFEAPLGVNEDQTIEVPDSFEKVAYYKYGPTPGELGPAVVLGHVDSFAGPAVFWPLKNLEPGDEIFVDREDGTTATFTVTKLEEHKQSGFPTEKVYGDLDHAGLRLITCSGVYDQGTLRYSHNLIVFAELTE